MNQQSESKILEVHQNYETQLKEKDELINKIKHIKSTIDDEQS